MAPISSFKIVAREIGVTFHQALLFLLLLAARGF
jgi:hypothetical protein